MSTLRILVPIDFSELSLKALEVAASLGKHLTVKITPFHAYIPVADIDGLYYMGMVIGSHANFSDIEPVIKDRLTQVAEDKVDKNLLTAPLISVGNAPQAIVEEAKNFDLVIMSTHGRTGFSRFLLGSVSEKVLRIAHTPILIVEEESVFEPLDKILVTTDFSENSFAAFSWARDFAKVSGAKIDFIHIIKYDEFKSMSTAQTFASLRKDRMNKLIEEYFGDIASQVHPEVILTSESPHESIFNLHFSRNYNLIVMATIGRTGLKYLTLGSTTANVVRTVGAPVLSINPLKNSPEEIS
ncbi:universal stress protein [Limnoraphis robusta]|uniref:Universal stress protein n=1 Tax=Limnoraphis robusta CCNP1315 TaxID=3110306 RepID=A0ABU5U183_9CYAN|nr:universal stress protein [Limnoraphis robusta]MEA5520834.1 universal stress protein [Limnoraphis robusta CCNP1315]